MRRRASDWRTRHGDGAIRGIRISLLHGCTLDVAQRKLEYDIEAQQNMRLLRAGELCKSTEQAPHLLLRRVVNWELCDVER